MVKYVPKNKKVQGGNSKDKIIWINKKSWRKSLTVRAGAGNDIINFKKSKYKNKLYGETGNDKIYGGTNIDYINGGAGDDIIYGYAGNDKIYGNDGKDSLYGGDGNDKIYGGKGNDVIDAGRGYNILYFGKGDGTDTVIKGGGTDTIVFTDKKNKKFKMKFSNNDLVFIYDGGKVKLKNFKKGNHSVQYVKIYGKKYKISDYENPYPIEVSSNNQKVWGTGLKDTIVVSGYNNKIYPSKGDDTITTKQGTNNIYFNSGDGLDIIKNPNGSATNVYNFLNEKSIEGLEFVVGGDTLIISYNNDKDYVYIHTDDYMWDELYGKLGFVETGGKIYSIGQTYQNTTSDVNIDGIIGTDIYDQINTNGYPSDKTIDIYSFGGNDFIDVDVDANVYAGDGEDTIYCKSSNNLFLSGGGDDDTYKIDLIENQDRETKIVISDTKLTGKGMLINKTYLSCSKDNILVYFNVHNDSSVDSDLYITFKQKGQGTVVVFDKYLDISKSYGYRVIADNSTPLYEEDDCGFVCPIYWPNGPHAHFSGYDFDTIKEDVANWLTSDGRNYDCVLDAINDTNNGVENFNILMSSDYFGKLQRWQ